MIADDYQIAFKVPFAAELEVLASCQLGHCLRNVRFQTIESRNCRRESQRRYKLRLALMRPSACCTLGIGIRVFAQAALRRSGLVHSTGALPAPTGDFAALWAALDFEFEVEYPTL